MSIDVHVDIETRSPVNLPKAGAARYFEDFDCLIVRWWRSDSGPDEIRRWWPQHEAMPSEFFDLVVNQRVRWWAHNAAFEMQAFAAMGIDIPVERWRCTQVMALALALPAHLAGLSEVLCLKQAKMKEGGGLIRLFSIPKKGSPKGKPSYNDWKSHPKDWELFDKYCEFDVRAEREAHNKMSRFTIPDWVWDQWHLNMRMNLRGLPIDLTLVGNAQRFDSEAKSALLDEMRIITGVDNPNSGPQLLPWLRERGYPYEDLTKDSVAKTLATVDVGTPLERTLKLRQKTARTSVAKYKKIEETVSSDGRVRGAFQYLGASRTGRDAGRLIQPQNLPGHSIEDLDLAVQLMRAGDFDGLLALWPDPTEVTKSLLRPAIRAPEGKLLRVADLSAIEHRVIGWLCNEPAILNLHRAGLDPYITFASTALGIPYEQVTKQQRKENKPPVLGCGFRLGGGRVRHGKRTGLWGYAESMGQDIERETAHMQVKVWRETHPYVVASWTELEDCFRAAMAGETVEWGPVVFDYRKPFVRVRLPSGRYLHYAKPQIKKIVAPWWEPEEHPPGTEPEMIDAIHYKGQYEKEWTWITTHGGKIVENLVQAIARDVMYEGFVAAAREGFEVLGSVHDEVVAMSDEGTHLNHTFLGELMSLPISWAPGLPLGAAGWSGPYYQKD